MFFEDDFYFYQILSLHYFLNNWIWIQDFPTLLIMYVLDPDLDSGFFICPIKIPFGNVQKL